MERVKVDTNIIDTFLNNKKMSKSEMSRGIGRARSFIANIYCGDGTIGASDYLSIKAIYGIDVKAQDEKKPEATKIKVKDNRLVSELTASELERLIYRATYSAIKHAN